MRSRNMCRWKRVRNVRNSINHARNSVGVNATKSGGMEACFQKADGKSVSPATPDASCVATGEKIGVATGKNVGPARENAGGACGIDPGFITRVLLELVELEALLC
jgi:hypothetical protein